MQFPWRRPSSEEKGEGGGREVDELLTNELRLIPKNPHVFDFVAHEHDVDKLIATTYNHAYMSNAKWKRFFLLLNEVCPDYQMIWMFVGTNGIPIRWVCPARITLLDTYLSDRFHFGPRYYKEIEWIEIPRVAMPYDRQMQNVLAARKAQNVDVVHEAIKAAGQWELELTDSGLRVYGFKK